MPSALFTDSFAKVLSQDGFDYIPSHKRSTIMLLPGGSDLDNVPVWFADSTQENTSGTRSKQGPDHVSIT